MIPLALGLIGKVAAAAVLPRVVTAVCDLVRGAENHRDSVRERCTDETSNRNNPVNWIDPSGTVYISETRSELLPSGSGNGFTGLWFLTRTDGTGKARVLLNLRAQVRNSNGAYQDLAIYDSRTWTGDSGGRVRPKPINQLDYGDVCAGATLSSLFIFANKDLIGRSEVVFRFDTILMQAGKAAVSNIASAAFDIRITSNEPNINILLIPQSN